MLSSLGILATLCGLTLSLHTQKFNFQPSSVHQARVDLIMQDAACCSISRMGIYSFIKRNIATCWLQSLINGITWRCIICTPGNSFQRLGRALLCPKRIISHSFSTTSLCSTVDHCTSLDRNRFYSCYCLAHFPGGLAVKNPPANAGNAGFDPWVGEDPLQKEMATHSSVLAWEILWTEKPSRLQSVGLQKSRTKTT